VSREGRRLFCILGENLTELNSLKVNIKGLRFITTFLLMICSSIVSLHAQIADSTSNFGDSIPSNELREYIDLQMHPTMHMTYSFFGKSFTYFEKGKEPKRSYKHLLKNVNFANYWQDNKGARIIVAGALNKEGIRNPKKARKRILAQLDYVNQFAADHADEFVVAKSPQTGESFGGFNR
jgi:hypothetical protein